MSTHRKQRRRVIDHLQAFRIAGFADGDERDVEFSRGVHLTLSRLPRTNLRRSRAAAPRQRGQGLKRGAGTAEMIDEGAKRARSDVLAADEAQPVEALLVGEVDAVRRFIHVCPPSKRSKCARMCEAVSGFCPRDHNPACRHASCGLLVGLRDENASLHPPLQGEGRAP